MLPGCVVRHSVLVLLLCGVFLARDTVRKLFHSRIVGLVLWLLAPDLVHRVVVRHSILLFILVLVRKLFHGRRCAFKRCIKWVIGDQGLIREAQRLKEQMSLAKNFEEWRESASRQDAFMGHTTWKNIEESRLYDHRRIRADFDTMTKLFNWRNIEDLMMLLRSRLQRNVGGIGNAKLYRKMLSGTKTLIEDYTRGVVRALNLVAMETDSGIPNMRKLAFFMETRHAYGRSALLLSGGATMGLYHAGVIRALLRQKMLPRIICGSSVGSIFAATVATRTEAELEKLAVHGELSLEAYPSKSPSIWSKLERLWKEGHVFDMDVMEQSVRNNVGELSFQEAYARTGRVLNIAVTAHGSVESAEPLLLNYLTTPNVLIWSAVCASCALLWVFRPVELMSKTANGLIVPHFSSGVMWADGSIKSDLPMRRLAEMFNVNHFIASQVNPHVIPFMEPQEMRGSCSSLLVKPIMFLGGELRDLIIRLSSLFVSKSLFSTIESIVSQSYVGSITLVPTPTFRLFLTMFLFENPTKEMYHSCVHSAELYTWRHMARISENCSIEFELDACVRQARAAVLSNSDIPLMDDHRQPCENMRSRLRSWSVEQFDVFREADKTVRARSNCMLEIPLAISPEIAQSSKLSPAETKRVYSPDVASDKLLGVSEGELLASELGDLDMMPLP